MQPGSSASRAAASPRPAGQRELRASRQKIARVFQDPYASLSPRRTIAASVAEPMEVHGLHSGKRERVPRVTELLEMFGLGSQFLRRHPTSSPADNASGLPSHAPSLSSRS